MSRAGAAAPAAAWAGRRAALAAVVAAAVAIAVRLPLAYRSFDLFGDEVIYTGLGRSVTSGGWPRNSEGPFFLHPPGFFYLEAGWARLLPRPADVVTAVYQMRTLNAVLAAITAAVLVLLAARAAGWRAGAAAGLLFALDPFCVRQNDRVLLETAMMLWVLLGYLVAAGLIGRSPPAGGRAWLRPAGAGLLFGCAVLTKDQAVLLTVLPLLVAAAAGWGPRRREGVAMAAIPVAVYGGYLAVAGLTGQFGTLWESKTAGARRLLGLQQITGFNSPSSPSLAARLAAEAAVFWPTYAVLVLAVPAVVLLLWRGGPLPRLLALLTAAAGVTLAYAVTLGTIEEWQLYLLVVPAILIAVTAAACWLGRRRATRAAARGGRPARAGGAGRGVAAAAWALLAVLLGAGLAASVGWGAVPDNGYPRLRQYLAAHVPAGSAVISVDDSPPRTRGTTYWLLSDRYRVGRWVTPAARARTGARYLVVPWAEVNQGYSYLTPARVRALTRGSRLLFFLRERTYGDLALYELPWPPRRAR